MYVCNNKSQRNVMSCSICKVLGKRVSPKRIIYSVFFGILYYGGFHSVAKLREYYWDQEEPQYLLGINHINYHKTSSISHTKSQSLNVSCIFPQLYSLNPLKPCISWEWRCSWSSADRRCSNYIWVINNFIAFEGATYIRGFTVIQLTNIQWESPTVS